MRQRREHNGRMEFKRIQSRVFMRGTKDHRTTVSLSENAFKALEDIASQNDQSVPEIIGDVVEAYLFFLAKEGDIPWPEGFDPKTKKWT